MTDSFGLPYVTQMIGFNFPIALSKESIKVRLKLKMI